MSSEEGINVHCSEFEASVWKPKKCRNCFRTEEEHKAPSAAGIAETGGKNDSTTDHNAEDKKSSPVDKSKSKLSSKGQDLPKLKMPEPNKAPGAVSKFTKGSSPTPQNRTPNTSQKGKETPASAQSKDSNKSPNKIEAESDKTGGSSPVSFKDKMNLFSKLGGKPSPTVVPKSDVNLKSPSKTSPSPIPKSDANLKSPGMKSPTPVKQEPQGKISDKNVGEASKLKGDVKTPVELQKGKIPGLKSIGVSESKTDTSTKQLDKNISSKSDTSKLKGTISSDLKTPLASHVKDGTEKAKDENKTLSPKVEQTDKAKSGPLDWRAQLQQKAAQKKAGDPASPQTPSTPSDKAKQSESPGIKKTEDRGDKKATDLKSKFDTPVETEKVKLKSAKDRDLTQRVKKVESKGIDKSPVTEKVELKSSKTRDITQKVKKEETKESPFDKVQLKSVKDKKEETPLSPGNKSNTKSESDTKKDVSVENEPATDSKKSLISNRLTQDADTKARKLPPGETSKTPMVEKSLETPKLNVNRKSPEKGVKSPSGSPLELKSIKDQLRSKSSPERSPLATGDSRKLSEKKPDANSKDSPDRKTGSKGRTSPEKKLDIKNRVSPEKKTRVSPEKKVESKSRASPEKKIETKSRASPEKKIEAKTKELPEKKVDTKRSASPDKSVRKSPDKEKLANTSTIEETSTAEVRTCPDKMSEKLETMDTEDGAVSPVSPTSPRFSKRKRERYSRTPSRGLPLSKQESQDEVQRLAAEIKILQERLQAMETANDKLESANQVMSERLDRPESERFESDDAKQYAADLQKKLAEMKELCDGLQDENEELKDDVEYLRNEMDEIRDQFREEEAQEYRELQKELELTAKNCRILQFKLRKAERKNEQVESDRMQYEDRIRKLECQYRSADDLQHIRELEDELEMAKEVSVRLHDELEMVEEKRSRYEEENEKLHDQVREYANKLLMTEKMIDRLRAELEAYRSQDSDISSQRQSPEGDSIPLKQETAQAVLPDSKRRVLKRSASYDTPTSMQERGNSQLQRDLEDLRERESDLKEQLKYAEEEVKIMRKKMNEMDNENESLLMQIKKMQSSKGEATKGLKGAKLIKFKKEQTAQMKREGSRDSISSVSSDDDDSTENMRLQMEIIEQENKVLRKKLQSMEQDNDNLYSEVKFLQERLAAGGKVDLSKYGADVELRVMMEEIDTLRWQLVEKDREIDTLKSEQAKLSAAQFKRDHLQRSRSLDTRSEYQIDATRQLEAVTSEINILKEKLTYLEKENEQLIKENRQLQLHKQRKIPSIKADDAVLENVELKEKLKLGEEENNQLRQKIRDLDQRTQNLSREVTKQEETRDTNAEKRQQELEEALRRAQEEVSSLGQKMAELQKEKDSLDKELEEARSKSEGVQRMGTEAKEKAKTTEGKIVELQEEIEDMIVIIKSKEVTNTKLEEDLVRMRNEMAELKTTFQRQESVLLDEIEQLKQRNQVLQNLLDLVTERADDIQEELDRYMDLGSISSVATGRSPSEFSQLRSPSDRSAVSVVSDTSTGSDDVFGGRDVTRDWEKVFKKRIESLEKLLADERQKTATLEKKIDIMTSDKSLLSEVKLDHGLRSKEKEIFQMEVIRYQVQLSMTSEKISDLEERLHKLQEVNDCLHSEIEELREGREVSADFKNTVWKKEKEELRKQLNKFMSKIDELNLELEEKQELWKTKEKEKGEIDAKAKESMASDIKKLKQESAQYQKETEEMKVKLQKAIDEMRQKERTWALERKRFENETSSNAGKLAEVNSTLQAKAEVVKELERTIRQKEKEMEELERDYFDVDNACQKQEHLTKQLDKEMKEVKEQLEQKKQLLQKRDTSIKDLNESIRARDERLKEKDDIIQKMNSGGLGTRQQREILTKLQTKEMEIHKYSKDVTELKSKIEVLTKEKDTWEKERSELLDKLSKLEDQVILKQKQFKEELSEERSDWEKEREQLKKQFEDLMEKRKVDEAKVDEIMKEFVKLSEIACQWEAEMPSGFSLSSRSRARSKSQEQSLKQFRQALETISAAAQNLSAYKDGKPQLQRSQSDDASATKISKSSADPMSMSYTEGSSHDIFSNGGYFPRDSAYLSGTQSASTSRDATPERKAGLERWRAAVKRISNYPAPPPSFLVSTYTKRREGSLSPARTLSAHAEKASRPFTWYTGSDSKPSLMKSHSIDTNTEEKLSDYVSDIKSSRESIEAGLPKSTYDHSSFSRGGAYYSSLPPSQRLKSAPRGTSEGENSSQFSPRTVRRKFFEDYPKSYSGYNSWPERKQHKVDKKLTEDTKTVSGQSISKLSETEQPSASTSAPSTLKTHSDSGKNSKAGDESSGTKSKKPRHLLSSKEKRGFFSRASSLESALSAVKSSIAKIGTQVLPAAAAPSNFDPPKVKSVPPWKHRIRRPFSHHHTDHKHDSTRNGKQAGSSDGTSKTSGSGPSTSTTKQLPSPSSTISSLEGFSQGPSDYSLNSQLSRCSAISGGTFGSNDFVLENKEESKKNNESKETRPWRKTHTKPS